MEDVILESYEDYVAIVQELGEEIAEDEILSEEEYNALSEEDLLELSKNTLASYAKKAGYENKDHYAKSISYTKTDPKTGKTTARWLERNRKTKNRSTGVTRAIDRLAQGTKGYLKNKKDEKANTINYAEEAELETEEKEGWSATNKTSDAKRKKINRTTNDGEKPVREETTVAEETLAASSLHPGAKSVADPKSKVEVIQHAIGAMHAMKKDDLVKWYNDSLKKFGHYGDGVGNPSDGNKSSINMKPSAANGKGSDRKDGTPKLQHSTPGQSVREDLEAIFATDETLTEDFKTQASTIFEAAINAAVAERFVELEEQFETAYTEALTEAVSELAEQLETYLDHAADAWMEENTVAIESSLRNDLTAEFINNLKGLFQEHYIDVPEDKVDVIETLQAENDELNKKYDAIIKENASLKASLVENTKEEVIESLGTGLTVTQQEKFAALAEGIDFDGNVDTYKKKLNIIKESYFKVKTTSSNIEEETFEGDIEDTNNVSSDPAVSRYVQAISRTVKK